MTALCILTPDPGYDEDWEPMAAHYRRLFGAACAFRPWTAPGALEGFALVLPLLAWGYQRQPGRWLAALDGWAAAGLAFANPLPMLRWNSDKAYLLDLDRRGVAIVPTMLVQALDEAALTEARDRFATGALVVKPPVSGGADGTYRLHPGDPLPADVQARPMLIQPMMAAIAEEGEYSLFYFAGRFGHAIIKRPAAGDFRVQEQFGGREAAVEAPAGALALARATLAALDETPAYARVDMVRDDAGDFRLMELELIEPSLFLDHAPDRGALFAGAVRARLSAP